MGVFSIGELANRAALRAQRSKARVRRNSLEKGTFEDRWYIRPAQDLLARQCDGRRMLDRKAKRSKNGARILGDAGDSVLRALHAAQDKRTGRLDVSLDYIEITTGYSRPTVCRALDGLEKYEFLDRRRRCQRTDVKQDEPGPRWKQATNVYRLRLPTAVAKMLGLKAMKPPIPDDEKDRRRAQSEAAKDMENQIDPQELGSIVTSDPELAAAINRLGATMAHLREECELRNLPQSKPLHI